MIRVILDEDKKKELQSLRNTRSNLAERSLYVLLSDVGLRVKSIAKRMGRDEHTVRTWLKAYIKDGIKGLISKEPPGRPRIKGCLVENEIENILTKTPRDFGYQEEGWTVRIMTDYFSKKNIEVKQDTVRRALRKKGWVYKRFARSVPKNAPTRKEKQDKIQEVIKKIQKEKPDEILFIDESNFMTGPYVQRGWFTKREKKRFPVQ